MTLPRVLVIGQPFNKNTGGGITLSSLFYGWDKDKIAVVCSGYELRDAIDTHTCDTYYQLGSLEHKWIFPFNLFKRKYSSGLVNVVDNQSTEDKGKRSKIRVGLIMNVFYPFLNYIGLFNRSSKIELSKKFCAWLDEFRPDIIYAQTTSRADNLFCLSVQSYLKKPLIYHMMDDWPAIINEKGIFRKYWNRKMDQEFRILLDKSAILMSISEEMAQEYKDRYNKNFVTFHNTIDIDFWKKHQRTRYELNNNPTILYAGRIGLGIEKSLELIARAIENVNRELNISLKFILQTKEIPLWKGNYECVEHSDFVAYNDLPEKFSSADFLLIPYDFSPKSRKYIKLSMPTKAPEYMISGTPIIVFAPEEAAIVKNATRYGWASVITEQSLISICGAVKELIENIELRRQIAESAKSIAEEKHNSLVIRDHFRKTIYSLIDHPQ